MLGRFAVLVFFLVPAALVAFGVTLRTSRAVESYEAVMDRMRRFEREARAASASEGVELEIVLAVACAESAGRPGARSSAGAVGLMQLLPGTAADMAKALGEGRPDLADPATSLRLGARYLRRQIDRFDGDPRALLLALAAYNAGPENAAAWREEIAAADAGAFTDLIPFAETRTFVRRVRDFEARWHAALAAPAR